MGDDRGDPLDGGGFLLGCLRYTWSFTDRGRAGGSHTRQPIGLSCRNPFQPCKRLLQLRVSNLEVVKASIKTILNCSQSWQFKNYETILWYQETVPLPTLKQPCSCSAFLLLLPLPLEFL